MSLYTIIPAKPFHQAKTRLASDLSLPQRIQLSRNLLVRTISVAQQVGQVVVVSRDKMVRKIAKSHGAWAIVESGLELNPAIQQATDWVVARNGQATLILPADLPLLAPADVAGLVNVQPAAPAMVIAPCHRGSGTNALYLSPPGIIPFLFGPDSFQQHIEAARRAGLDPIVYRTDSLAFDLDLPEDLNQIGSVSRLNLA